MMSVSLTPIVLLALASFTSSVSAKGMRGSRTTPEPWMKNSHDDDMMKTTHGEAEEGSGIHDYGYDYGGDAEVGGMNMHYGNGEDEFQNYDMPEEKNGGYGSGMANKPRDTQPVSSNYGKQQASSSGQKTQTKTRASITGLSAAISLEGTTEKALLASTMMQNAILEGYAAATNIPASKIVISKIGGTAISTRRLQESQSKSNEVSKTEDPSMMDKAQDTASAAGTGIKTAAAASANAVSGAASSAASGIQSLWNDITADSLRVHFTVTAGTVADEAKYEAQMNSATAAAVQGAILAKAKTSAPEFQVQDFQVTSVSKAVEAGTAPKEDSLLGRVSAASGVSTKVVAGSVAGAFILISMCALYICCIRKNSKPAARANGPVSTNNVERQLDLGAKYTGPQAKF